MTTDRVVHKTGQATADIHELADYFRSKAGREVALRFIDNAERAFEQLRAMPRIGVLLGLDELLQVRQPDHPVPRGVRRRGGRPRPPHRPRYPDAPARHADRGRIGRQRPV